MSQSVWKKKKRKRLYAWIYFCIYKYISEWVYKFIRKNNEGGGWEKIELKEEKKKESKWRKKKRSDKILYWGETMDSWAASGGLDTSPGSSANCNKSSFHPARQGDNLCGACFVSFEAVSRGCYCFCYKESLSPVLPVFSEWYRDFIYCSSAIIIAIQ